MLGYPPEQAERLKREYAFVQLDRMAVYTGTYYGDEPSFERPQFTDDSLSFTGGGTPPRACAVLSARARNPFDLGTDGPQFDDLNRTQPMSSRTPRPRQAAAAG